MRYQHLARALLDAGDTSESVIEFLRLDYGLDGEQALRAVHIEHRRTSAIAQHIGAASGAGLRNETRHIASPTDKDAETANR